jgi:hypothetical protein
MMIATLEADILFRVLAFVQGAEHVAVSECSTAMHACLLEAQGQSAYQLLSVQVQQYAQYLARIIPLLLSASFREMHLVV